VQLLLRLVRAVTLGSESRRTHDHILLSFETPQSGEPGPRIYIPQEQAGPVIPPDTGLPFRRFLRLASTPVVVLVFGRIKSDAFCAYSLPLEHVYLAVG
jgi:hypothetical protein